MSMNRTNLGCTANGDVCTSNSPSLYDATTGERTTPGHALRATGLSFRTAGLYLHNDRGGVGLRQSV